MCRDEAMMRLLLLGSFATFATRSRTAKEEIIYLHAWMKIEIVPFTRATACTSREKYLIEKMNDEERKSNLRSSSLESLLKRGHADDRVLIIKSSTYSPPRRSPWEGPERGLPDRALACSTRTRCPQTTLKISWQRFISLAISFLPTGHPYLNNQSSFIACFSLVRWTYFAQLIRHLLRT